MSTKTLSIAAAIMALFFIGTSCNNKQKNTEETATTEQTTGAMEIDDLLANATVSLITGRSSHTDVRLHKRKRDMKERKK